MTNPTTPAHTCQPGCANCKHASHDGRCEAVESSDFVCGCVIMRRGGLPCIACDLQVLYESFGTDAASDYKRERLDRIAARLVELEAENAKLTDANAALGRLCGELP